MNVPSPTDNATRHDFLSRPELWVFGGLILVFSGSVLFGSAWQSMIFQPGAVKGGEWWRLLTHPFVHVTWYHLLLDASAFLLLYHSLLEPKLSRRLAYVIASAVGSLALSWLAAPAIATGGLCGLSGIAHGLMAVSAVEMMLNQSQRSSAWKTGLVTFALVIGKAAYEAITGHILFGFLYFGMVGEPVAISHAGGIVGGLLVMLLLRVKRAQTSKHQLPGSGEAPSSINHSQSCDVSVFD
jgi:rhomboid family GlyGly-CTERM serine protease